MSYRRNTLTMMSVLLLGHCRLMLCHQQHVVVSRDFRWTMTSQNVVDCCRESSCRSLSCWT